MVCLWARRMSFERTEPGSASSCCADFGAAAPSKPERFRAYRRALGARSRPAAKAGLLGGSLSGPFPTHPARSAVVY